MRTAPAWPVPFWLYRLSGEVAAPVVAGAVRYKYRNGALAARNPERWGHASQDRPDGPLLWVHAASLGETQSILGLLCELQIANPNLQILLTHWTESAAGLADSPANARFNHAFFPIDTGPSRRRFLAHWRPDAALFVESEIWPGWIDALHRRAIPVALVNARLSEKSARRWAAWPRMARAITGRLDQVVAQNTQVAQRLARLGLADDRLSVSGDLKAALPPPAADDAQIQAWQTAIATRPCWAAASTHPGEDDLVLAAHAALRQRNPDALLLLIPRHPERADQIAALAANAGLSLLRHSEGRLPQPHHTVVLADGFGAMGLWYRLSQLVFVGGSMAPLGGHNPFEPAKLNNALLTGPHISNFANAFAKFAKAGGAEIVSKERLASRVSALMQTPELTAMADAAYRVAHEADDIPAQVCTALLNGALKGV